MKPGQRGDLRRDNARSYPEADFVPAKLPRRPGSILIDIRFSNEIDLNQSGSSNHGRWNGIDKLFTIDLISARRTCLRQVR